MQAMRPTYSMMHPDHTPHNKLSEKVLDKLDKKNYLTKKEVKKVVWGGPAAFASLRRVDPLAPRA